LLAILETHNLSSSTRQRKEETVKQLLIHLPAVISHFAASENDAILALIAADGRLPALRFQERFGLIRPHQPWRKGSPKENPKQSAEEKPWLAPNSTSERLLYLGLIYQQPSKPKAGQQQYFVMPAELFSLCQQHLSNLAPQNANISLQTRPGQPANLLHHLGIWLASIAERPIKLRNQRWLLPNMLDTLIQRLGLNEPIPCRSERSVPYLAFLHRLAQQGNLIEESTTIQLTPAAWEWLALPPTQRVQALWQIWQSNASATQVPIHQNIGTPSASFQDETTKHNATFHFKWEHLSDQAQSKLLDALTALKPGHFQPLHKWIHQLRLTDQWGILPKPSADEWSENTLPAESASLSDPLSHYCCQPLFWLGILDIAIDQETTATFFQLTQTGSWLLQQPNSQPTPIAIEQPITIHRGTPDLFIATSQTSPLCIARIVPYCTWKQQPLTTSDSTDNRLSIGEQRLQLSAERIAQAVAHNISTIEINNDLALALGHPSQPQMPSQRLQRLIRKWAKEGQRVRIQTQTIVQTENAQLMAELRRKKLIRNRLGPSISPNRAIINPNQIPALIQTLATLNIYTANPFNGQPDTSSSPNLGEGRRGLPPATQWMLLQLYRALGQHIDLPAKIPWETQKALESQLSATERMSAAETARTIAAQIESSLNGYLRIPSWKMPILMESDNQPSIPNPKSPVPNPQSPTTIKRILQQTIATNQPIRIHYWSANQDQPLQRTVTPYYIEERNHIQYLTAYCHLRDEERTFRIDRISQAELSV